jgi:hypothetical protein
VYCLNHIQKPSELKQEKGSEPQSWEEKWNYFVKDVREYKSRLEELDDVEFRKEQQIYF